MKTRVALASVILLSAALSMPAGATLTAAHLPAPDAAAERAPGQDMTRSASSAQGELAYSSARGDHYAYLYLPIDLNPVDKAGPADTEVEYHTKTDSPAVAASVNTDIRGNVVGRPDLVAHELLVALLITKQADPDRVKAGGQLTYTIQVTNTGDTDLHATVTDTLPTHILPGETEGGAPILPGGMLTWTPIITAPGGIWRQTIIVTVETDYAGLLTNTVTITTWEGATGSYTETSVAYVEDHFFLPLVSHEVYTGPCRPELLTELASGPESRQVALDLAGRRAFIAHADGVTVIDADSYAVITTTQAATKTHGIAFDPGRNRIWVTRLEADRVVVLDGASYTVLADLPTGDEPHSVAYNPANGYVYVTNWRDWTVSVYNAETLTQVMELTNFAEPGHLAVNSRTNKIYVANHRPENSVTVIDGATHATDRIPVKLQDAYAVAVDVLRNLVYATAIAHGRMSVIDAATEEELGYVDFRRSSGERIPLRVVVVNPHMGPEGHLLLVTSSEDGGRDQLLLLPNGWPTFGTPVPLDIASYPLDGIALDPYLDRVWVTSVGSGVVSVVRDGYPICPTPLSYSVRNESAVFVDVITSDSAAFDEP